MNTHFSELFEQKNDTFIAKKDIRLGAALIKKATVLNQSELPFDFRSIADKQLEVRENDTVIQIVRIIPD